MMLRLLALVIAILLPSAGASAQGSQIDARGELRRELFERGIDEAEFVKRLEANGIKLDTLTPAGARTAAPTLRAVVDSMAAEAAAKRGAGIVESGEPMSPPRDPRQVRATTVAASDSTPDSDDVFGRDAFRRGNVLLYQTSDGAVAPNHYVLGTGDVLRVSIFGVSQGDLTLTVDSLGFVAPANLPRVSLAGLTLERARSVLRSRLSGFYRYQPDQIEVALKSARTVSVAVYGEVRQPGTFSVSALNSAYNVLVAALGPSEIGSLRSIRLIRGGGSRAIDVYKLLLSPEESPTLDLRENDVVFVPVAQKIVKLQGAVRRPMRYELVDGESLADLLDLAGGVAFDAFPDFVQIERVENDEVVLRELPLQDVLRRRTAVALQDGDVVTVRTIGRDLQRYVSAAGAVYYPGRFDLDRVQTLGQLLRSAQPVASAYPGAYIVRTDTANSANVEHIPVVLDTLSAFLLQPRDSLLVLDNSMFTEEGGVYIGGEVRRPFSAPYDPSLSVGDLVRLANGLTVEASVSRVDVFRLRLRDTLPSTFERIEITLATAENGMGVESEFRLQPFDRVFVRRKPQLNLERAVVVTGEVSYPGTYMLRGEQVFLSEILETAGGLTANASRAYLRIVRKYADRGEIGVNLTRALQERGSPSADPVLVDGDSVVVLRTENTVTIRLAGTRRGEAARRLGDLVEQEAVSFAYQGPHRADWYLQNFAGGFSRHADRGSVVVVDAGGQVTGTLRRAIFFRRYPFVSPGSTILLTEKEMPESGEKKAVDWDAVLARSSQALTTVLTLLVLSRQL